MLSRRLLIDPRKLLSQAAPHGLGEGRAARANTEPDQALPAMVEVGHLAARREPVLNEKSPPGFFLSCNTEPAHNRVDRSLS